MKTIQITRAEKTIAGMMLLQRIHFTDWDLVFNYLEKQTNISLFDKYRDEIIANETTSFDNPGIEMIRSDAGGYSAKTCYEILVTDNPDEIADEEPPHFTKTGSEYCRGIGQGYSDSE